MVTWFILGTVRAVRKTWQYPVLLICQERSLYVNHGYHPQHALNEPFASPEMNLNLNRTYPQQNVLMKANVPGKIVEYGFCPRLAKDMVETNILPKCPQIDSTIDLIVIYHQWSTLTYTANLTFCRYCQSSAETKATQLGRMAKTTRFSAILFHLLKPPKWWAAGFNPTNNYWSNWAKFFFKKGV